MSFPPFGGAAQFGYSTPNLAAASPAEDSGEEEYRIFVRQQPEHAKVTQGKEKDRKPVDPPPILQLKVGSRRDPNQNFLQSPYYFMSCTLIKGRDDPSAEEPGPNALVGTLVSSLHRLKDTDNTDGGFFVFGDLSVKKEGTWRLLFTLYKMADRECVHITSATSEAFTAHQSKSFPGMAESTFLTRSFSDQGVRLRLRKDSRSITTRKRNNAAADFARHHSHHDLKTEQQKQKLTNGLATGGRTNSLGDNSDSLGTPVGRGRDVVSAQGSNYFDVHGSHQGDYSRAPGGPFNAYAFEDGPSHKRQRMVGEEASQGYEPDFSGYPTRSVPQASPQVTSAMGAFTTPFTMPPVMPATTLPPYPTGHLQRINTQVNSSYPTGPGSAETFASPRQSPGGSYHAYQHGSGLHSTSGLLYSNPGPTGPSPFMTNSPHAEYQAGLRGSAFQSNSSAEVSVSPRSHPTSYGQPTSSAGTSPPDPNYTTSSGPGPITGFPGSYHSPLSLSEGHFRGQSHLAMGGLRMSGANTGDQGLATASLYQLDDDDDKHNPGPGP